jgi:hypothetical protein
MKIFIHSFFLFVFIFSQAVAELSNSATASMANAAKELAQSENQSNTIRSYISRYSFGLLNSEIDKKERKIESSTNFTHLNLNIGSDSLGLRNGSSALTELMAVYRLYETPNSFFFNQTSLSNFDGRNTVNIGIGARYIFNADTTILGANTFFDYELDSAHRRLGFGGELITSLLEIRANSYDAQSGTVSYKGVDETALDGHDIKFTGKIPYADIYFEKSYWTDNSGYKTNNEELGISAEITKNLTLTVAQQKKEAKDAVGVIALNYSIPLGAKTSIVDSKADRDFTFKLRSVRSELYKPVQRENRIMKKSIKLGVTVSGY